MSAVTNAVRDHHRELFENLDSRVGALAGHRPDADAAELAAYLARELLPHAEGEEAHMYPAVEPLVKAHGEATATMRVDHEFIASYVRRIGETARALQSARSEEREALQARAARLALQLEAVLEVHLAKEERVYLPLFEEYLSEATQQAVLDGMHAAYPDKELA